MIICQPIRTQYSDRPWYNIIQYLILQLHYNKDTLK